MPDRYSWAVTKIAILICAIDTIKTLISVVIRHRAGAERRKNRSRFEGLHFEVYLRALRNCCRHKTNTVMQSERLGGAEYVTSLQRLSTQHEQGVLNEVNVLV